MNSEHTKELLKTAPLFYSGRKEPMTQNLMCFGFECGDGWFYPLLELSENIEAINLLAKPYGVFAKAVQVKEKFGTLRVYFNVVTKLPWWKKLANQLLLPFAKLTHYRHFLGFGDSQDQIILYRAIHNIVERMVDKCEERCMDYCEECGTQFMDWNKDEKVTTTGWIKIVCKECAEKNSWSYVPYGVDPYEVGKKSVKIPTKRTASKKTSTKKTSSENKTKKSNTKKRGESNE